MIAGGRARPSQPARASRFRTRTRQAMHPRTSKADPSFPGRLPGPPDQEPTLGPVAADPFVCPPSPFHRTYESSGASLATMDDRGARSCPRPMMSLNRHAPGRRSEPMVGLSPVYPASRPAPGPATPATAPRARPRKPNRGRRNRGRTSSARPTSAQWPRPAHRRRPSCGRGRSPRPLQPHAIGPTYRPEP